MTFFKKDNNNHVHDNVTVFSFLSFLSWIVYLHVLIFLPRFQGKPLFWLDSWRFFMQIHVVDMSKAHFSVRFKTIFVVPRKKEISYYMKYGSKIGRFKGILRSVWDYLSVFFNS